MRSYMQTYVSGAILIELLSAEVVRVREDQKVEVVQRQYDGDEAALMMLHKLENSKTKTMKKWIQHLYTRTKDRSELFQAVVKPLVRQGHLNEDERRVMLVFPVIRYVPSAKAKDLIVQRIRAELLENGPITEQTALLTMMLEASKLLKSYFSEYERKELKECLQRLQDEQNDKWKTIRMMHKAIQEMDAAMVSVAAVAAT